MQVTSNEKTWYSVKELSAEWGVSEGWIRDHANRKQPRIVGRKFGKFIKFHRDDLEAFIASISTMKPR